MTSFICTLPRPVGHREATACTGPFRLPASNSATLKCLWKLRRTNRNSATTLRDAPKIFHRWRPNRVSTSWLEGRRRRRVLRRNRQIEIEVSVVVAVVVLAVDCCLLTACWRPSRCRYRRFHQKRRTSLWRRPRRCCYHIRIQSKWRNRHLKIDFRILDHFVVRHNIIFYNVHF